MTKEQQSDLIEAAKSIISKNSIFEPCLNDSEIMEIYTASPYSFETVKNVSRYCHSRKDVETIIISSCFFNMHPLNLASKFHNLKFYD